MEAFDLRDSKTLRLQILKDELVPTVQSTPEAKELFVPRNSISASSTASLTICDTSDRLRLGSLRFTNERMRWMI